MSIEFSMKANRSNMVKIASNITIFPMCNMKIPQANLLKVDRFYM